MWYRFDDASGSLVADSSGNGNHLAFDAGGGFWDQKAGAPFGGSLHFSGTGSAIAQRTSVETQPQTINFLRSRTGNKVTISFWVNPEAQAQDTAPFGFLRSGSQRILQSRVLFTNSTANFDVAAPGSGSAYHRLTSGVTTAPAGAWTHWAMVFDGSLSAETMKIYRNSVLLASSATGSGATIDWAGMSIFEIGYSQIYDDRWVGSLDDFAVWDEALPSSDIFRIYTGGVQVLLAPRIDSFLATPGNVAPGSGSVLSWSTRAATSLTIDQGIGAVSGASGSVSVTPAASTSYRLTAANAQGSVTRDVLVAVGATAQPLVLNEFLADNLSGLLDEDGACQDWIEIHNPNPFAVSANGWQLLAGDAAWSFPEVQIEGGAYLVVFASGKNRTNPAGTLHTNFKLSAGGEYLALKKPDGTVASEFTPAFPEQRADISFGPGTQPSFYLTPTPSTVNGPSIEGFVADTNFSIKRGFYSSPQTVAITCATVGAQIRYTLDNSTPTETNGTVYSGPLGISNTTVLRACAFKSGLAPSNPDTQTYLFLANVPSQGPAPAGWPASGVNGQVLRYGFNSNLRAQYPASQIVNALQQLPTLSVVTDQANLTSPSSGIYVNALLKGDALERPSSVELLNPNGGTGFHINCGLRIRGGNSRNDQFPKHSMRLAFRRQYGDGSLKFPLFGTAGTDEFEVIDLRTEQNYAWTTDSGTQHTAVREVFCRDLFRAMNEPGTRSSYYHLYLNGQYWGLYMTEERAQEDYGASYLGGVKEDYDVVQTSNHPNFLYELSSGTIAAWQRTWTLARACAANPSNANYFALLGRNAAGVRVSTMPVYVDAEHLANYMLLHYYTGDGDGPLSGFLGFNRANNWRGMRNRLGDAGWRFFPHDSEHTLLAPGWIGTRAIAKGSSTTTGGSNRGNFSYSNPEWIHEDLATNLEYRMKIADAAQKHLLNGGVMTSARAQAFFDARAAQLGNAIVADCVRWGTSTTNHTLAQWNARLNSIRSEFFSARPAEVIGHLRTRGFFPSLNAPVFSRRGGKVAPGYELTLSPGAQGATIYYTLDGTDPRVVGGAVAAGAQTFSSAIPITQSNTLVRTRLRDASGNWSALDEAVFSLYAPAAAGTLVISKVHYNPPSGSTGEYLELQNVGDETLDLTGVEISGGVTFAFSGGNLLALEPGARVLVVGDIPAFTSLFGSGLPVAGQFEGNLNNAGEAIAVTGAGGAPILDFFFDDQGAWPAAADGSGSALVLLGPTLNPKLGTSWRASYVPGGVPGAVDEWTLANWRTQYFSASDLADPAKEATLWGTTADPDADGFTNLEELVLAGVPVDPQLRPQFTSALHLDPNSGQQFLRTSAVLRDGVSGVAVAALGSDDLVTWSPGPTLVAAVPQGNGTSLATWQDNVSSSASPAGRRFLRLQLTGN